MATKVPDDRQVRLAKMQAAQKSQERRRSVLVIAIAASLAVILVGVVIGVIVQSQREQNDLQRQAEGDIVGVQDFGEQDATHVTTPVDYDVMPPVGGDHMIQWQNCGFYDAPIITEAGVHSLEHGAVWVTYDPDLPAEQVTELERLAADNGYLLVSPMADLPSPVVASAWGLQLQLDSVNDERLRVFLVKYLQGEQTQEPGATCSGSIDTTA